MADRRALAEERNMAAARMFYQSALSDYDHALVLDPQVGGDIAAIVRNSWNQHAVYLPWEVALAGRFCLHLFLCETVRL